jgi:2-polyprenyl-3-methyl-5-hydroxy-6-metoxy-1,4-benzoquinol methylase
MTLASEKYKEGGIYDRLDYGSPYISKGLKFTRYMQPEMVKGLKVLCVGCGNGYEVVQLLHDGYEAYGTELHPIDIPILEGRIINALVPDLPFRDKEFPVLFCCEVIEHIPPESTPDFVRELSRVAHNLVISIATADDPPWHTHINLRHPANWLLDFEKWGFEIVNFQFAPVTDYLVRDGTMARQRSGNEGVLIYCR